MRKGEIASRVAALRIPITVLAELSGLNKHTVHYLVHGRRDSRGSTRDRLLSALEKEELRLRDYLVSLHGPAGVSQ